MFLGSKGKFNSLFLKKISKTNILFIGKSWLYYEFSLIVELIAKKYEKLFKSHEIPEGRAFVNQGVDSLHFFDVELAFSCGIYRSFFLWSWRGRGTSVYRGTATSKAFKLATWVIDWPKSSTSLAKWPSLFPIENSLETHESWSISRIIFLNNSVFGNLEEFALVSAHYSIDLLLGFLSLERLKSKWKNEMKKLGEKEGLGVLIQLSRDSWINGSITWLPINHRSQLFNLQQGVWKKIEWD